jgi:hypothetical protein
MHPNLPFGTDPTAADTLQFPPGLLTLWLLTVLCAVGGVVMVAVGGGESPLVLSVASWVSSVAS